MEQVMEQDVELLIIGGGPAGVAAAVYAARKQLRTMLVTESYGGQSIVSSDIRNWIGTPSISGDDLAGSFKKHVETHRGDFLSVSEARVTALKKEGNVFTADFTGGGVSARALFIATGATRRQLAIPGADEFEHKGLTYCASCDGPLFAGKRVAVIGGGNAGFETAAQLLAYAEQVTLLHRNSSYKADAVTVEKVLKHPNMTGITDASITRVFGNGLVKGIGYMKDGKEHELAVEGVFVEIGLIPATDIIEGLVELDSFKKIVVDPRTQQTSDPGVWAAGDCSSGMFHQNNIAAGDAVKALEHIYITLRAR